MVKFIFKISIKDLFIQISKPDFYIGFSIHKLCKIHVQGLYTSSCVIRKNVPDNAFCPDNARTRVYEIFIANSINKISIIISILQYPISI